VKDVFERIGIEEMKHAESIAERLFYLGGMPTTKPEPISVGKSLKEMVQGDIKAEEKTIVMYKDVITLATKEGDPTTAHLFTEILADEEEHHDTFKGLLEGA
jgi:bacterioferritin